MAKIWIYNTTYMACIVDMENDLSHHTSRDNLLEYDIKDTYTPCDNLIPPVVIYDQPLILSRLTTP